MTEPGHLAVPFELRLVTRAGEVGRHNCVTLAAQLMQVPPGAWCSLWPGLAGEQVFGRCEGCGQPMACPVSVQLRRLA